MWTVVAVVADSKAPTTSARCSETGKAVTTTTTLMSASLGQQTGDTQVRRSRVRQPGPGRDEGGPGGVGREPQRQAWHWALAHRASDESLPSGR